MDRAALIAQGRDALAKLDQDPLLQIHPLAALLLPDAPPASRGAAFKQLLLDLIARVRPAHTVPYHAPVWRQYRVLTEFYVEGKTLDEIAADQGVSSRQARRDHHQALERLGDFLWARYAQVAGTASAVSEAPTPSEEDERSLEIELQRIDALPVAEPIPFEALLRSVVAMVGQLAEHLGTRIECEVADALGSVNANPTALRQALLSVLDCVVESTPGGQVRVFAGGTPRGVDLRIRSEDWQPGRVADVPERLRLGRRLLEQHGGQLEVGPLDRPRAEIHLSVPFVPAPTVLIVDDNPDLLRLFQRYLDPAAFRLAQATTVSQALDLVGTLAPRLIILDLMLPLRDGWELLQLLKQDPATRAIPVVVCSVVHERALALAMGASAFLPKPVSRAALLQVLEERGLGAMDRFQAGPKTAHQLPDAKPPRLGDPEEAGRHHLVAGPVSSDQNDRDVP